MKKVVLCADDYGQNEAISQAIIALIAKNHLSATSCMTNAPDWPMHAQWLVPFKQQVDVGLHFNLTEGSPVSAKLMRSHGFLSLSSLLLKAYSRRLDTVAIEAELHAQLDRFVQAVGQLPHFIDGHQHIHQLPQIRHVLFKVYEERLKHQGGCYLRCVYEPQFSAVRQRRESYVKRLILQKLGAKNFFYEVVEQHIPHNSSFAGVYRFVNAKQYAELFPYFLAGIQSGGIIMCHPGLMSQHSNDAIAQARGFEFEYLTSDRFTEDCMAQGVELARFKFCT